MVLPTHGTMIFVEVAGTPVFSDTEYQKVVRQYFKACDLNKSRVDIVYYDSDGRHIIDFRESLIRCTTCDKELGPHTTWFYQGVIYCNDCLPVYVKQDQW